MIKTCMSIIVQNQLLCNLMIIKMTDRFYELFGSFFQKARLIRMIIDA